MATTIHVTMNTRAFVRNMMRNDDMIKKKSSQLVDKFAMWMKIFAKDYCPVDEGKLKNSIRVYKNGLYEANVKTSVKYASYVEYGTGIHNANGNGRRTPWWYLDKRRNIFIKTRGQKPKFFFKRGFETTMAGAEQIVQGVFKWR